MKGIKNCFVKWWFWVITTAVFLITVQIVFRIEAPCKWLDAVWEAGDLISLVGTLVLGYVAVLQTQRANDMAQDANETSRKLIELQHAEYMPVVTIEDFAGITKHNLENLYQSLCSEMFVHEMRTSDGDVLVGYSVSLVDQNCDISKQMYCRGYEIHLSYSGHFVVEGFQIKKIRFVGKDYEKIFEIENIMEMSLGHDEKFTLFLFLFSNENFLDENTEAHKYLTAAHVVFEVEMKSIAGELYKETIKVRKLLVKNPSPEMKLENAEMLVSASYRVREEKNQNEKVNV